MRTTLIALMLAPVAIQLLIVILSYPQFLKFLKQTPEIRTTDDLDRFRKLATVQMYVSLVAMYITPVPLVVWGYGKFFVGVLTWLDLLIYVVLPAAAVMALASLVFGSVDRVRSTPTDPSLEKQKAHIVDVWLNRHLPRF